MRSARGYERVTIPHITKKELYEKSGHWDKFSKTFFRITSREGREYALKPMNCPHHTQIFARRPHSYREMPQRYAGDHHGLPRRAVGRARRPHALLSITQDDSHILPPRAGQGGFFRLWDIVDVFYISLRLPKSARASPLPRP